MSTMGRKKAERPIILKVRVSPEERRVFEAEAEARGMTLSAFIRKVLKTACQRGSRNARDSG